MADNSNRGNDEFNELSDKAKAFKLAMQNAQDSGRKGGQSRPDRNAPITRRTLIQHRAQQNQLPNEDK